MDGIKSYVSDNWKALAIGAAAGALVTYFITKD